MPVRQKIQTSTLASDSAVRQGIRLSRKLQCLERVLLCQKNRNMPLALAPLDTSENLLSLLRREAMRGLIQKKQPRTRHKGACKHQHLPFATCQLAAVLQQPGFKLRKKRQHRSEEHTSELQS